jgi:hypothetical protein
MRKVVICVCVAAACSAISGSIFADDTLYFTSSPTSWVGHGQTRTITPSNGFTFNGFRYFSQGAYTNAVSISLTSSTEFWYLDFVGPHLTLPVTGSYPNAARWPFQSSDQPGLSFVGDGRGDNELIGSFEVLDATFDGSGNLLSFAADFTQYDEGDFSAWNRGSIRYHSAVPVPEPSSVLLAIAGALICGGAVRRRRYDRRQDAKLTLSTLSGEILWHNPMKGYGAGTPASLASVRGQSSPLITQAAAKHADDSSASTPGIAS